MKGQTGGKHSKGSAGKKEKDIRRRALRLRMGNESRRAQRRKK